MLVRYLLFAPKVLDLECQPSYKPNFDRDTCLDYRLVKHLKRISQ